MSEVVVRMEMPKRCYYCPMFDDTEHRCIVQYYKEEVNSVDLSIAGKGRMNWCPIICALPEGHGRLVDADALESRCRPVKNFENQDSLVIGVGPLRCSKTIVPPTEGGNHEAD